MSICVNCGNGFTGKRADAKTCSDACRSAVYYKRKTATKRWKDCNLDLFDSEDVRLLGRISYDAAEVIIKVANVAGREVAKQVIDGMCDLLTKSHVSWQNE